MDYLGILIGSVIGYFIGSVSWSIIVVKYVKGIDIRSVGSKNAGATNTSRELGKLWGLIVVFLDGLKVVITALIVFCLSMIPNSLFSQTSYFIPAIFVLIGHCFPIFYNFKGGKAVACFLGLLCISNIWFLFFFLILWFFFAWTFRKVSVASIIAAIFTGGIFIWLPWVSGTNEFSYWWNSYSQWAVIWQNPWLRFTWLNYLHEIAGNVSGYYFADSLLEINIIVVIGMLILAYRHFPNIERIKKRQEPQTFPNLTPEERAAQTRYIKDRSAKQELMKNKKIQKELKKSQVKKTDKTRIKK